MRIRSDLPCHHKKSVLPANRVHPFGRLDSRTGHLKKDGQTEVRSRPERKKRALLDREPKFSINTLFSSGFLLLTAADAPLPGRTCPFVKQPCQSNEPSSGCLAGGPWRLLYLTRRSRS